MAINELGNKVRIQKINQTESQFLEKSDKAVSGKDPGQQGGRHERRKVITADGD